MESDFNYIDGVRWEFFELMFPKLLYKGSDEARSGLFSSLRGNGQEFIYSVFCQMCEEDGSECPYGATDFKVKVFSRGTLEFIQIILPPYNPGISDIVRAYILCSGDSDFRYFLIKHFKEGDTFILYADPEFRVLKMEELTAHVDDIDYEYWRLAVSYLTIMQDSKSDESDESQGYWSRDWRRVDWKSVKKKLRNGEKEIGLMEDEYWEFLHWCAENEPEVYRQTAFYLALRKCNFSDNLSKYLAVHPEKLREAIEYVKK